MKKHWEEGGGRILSGVNAGGHAAADEVQVLEFVFQLESLVYTVYHTYIQL
jgi:hypothetical protein